MYPSNEEINQELQPSVDATKAFKNDVVSTPQDDDVIVEGYVLD